MATVSKETGRRERARRGPRRTGVAPGDAEPSVTRAAGEGPRAEAGAVVSAEGGGRPTLRTIAERMGVGVTTVSRALADAPDIGSRTKERAREVAREVGYHPNRAGQRLRTGRTNVIGVVLSTEVGGLGLSSALIHGLASGLAGTPYHLVLVPFAPTDDPLGPVRYVVESKAADGIVFANTMPEDPRARYLLDSGFPFVTHGRTGFEHRHPFVDFDNAAYAEGAARRLAARGRRRAALVAPPASLAYGREMRLAWSRAGSGALARVTTDPVTSDAPLDVLVATLRDALSREDAPDAIVCGGVTAAVATLEAAAERGLRIGTDLDLVTKVSHAVVERLLQGAILVREDYGAAGESLSRLLMARIAAPEAPPAQTVERPRFPD